MTVVPLADAADERIYGGKARSLSVAIRAGLPVPSGFAVPAPLVERVAAGDGAALASVQASSSSSAPGGRMAVRSSAIGEDSVSSSFAGQHATRLNVGLQGLADAVRAVWESAGTGAALAYRERRGIDGRPAIGVVIQTLIEPLAAGVLFTRDPLTGADERVIEASWGLGEAVVSGRVVPDRYRIDRQGRVVEAVPGDKDVKVWFGEGDGTIELPVEPPLRRAPCLAPDHLAQLHRLSERCRAVWNMDLDLEWALDARGIIHLLQSRPITTLGMPSA